MGILAFIIIGLIAGLLARAIVPGKQSLGLIATTLLGMVGSLVGGLVGSLFSRGEVTRLHPAGIIMSVIGAIVVLLIFSWATSRSSHRRVHT